MRSILAPVLLSFLCPAVLAQHTYYCSAAAGHREAGFSTVPPDQLSHLHLGSGDSVIFQGMIQGPVVLSGIGGSMEAPVVFTCGNNDSSTIDGGNGPALQFSHSAYVHINGLTVKGAGRKTGNTSDGIKLTDCHDVVLRNGDISGFQKSGLLLYNCQAVTVDKVYSHDNGFAGILVEGDYQERISRDIRIVDCRADNNPGDPTNLENHSGNGILVGNCRNVLIEYCTATNNGWDMPRKGNGPVGIWAYEADSVIIQHCISYRNKTASGAADGGGFDLDGGVTNSVIQYCLSYENAGSGYGIFEYAGAGPWRNNTVRYCISINDGNVTDKASGMFIWNGGNADSLFSGFYAYNNLFYNRRKYVVSFEQQSAHRAFYWLNNIFVASDTSDIYFGNDVSRSDRFLGNVWLRQSGGFRQHGFTDFTRWAQATGMESDDGQVTGITFSENPFRLPDSIKVTDPHGLVASPVLLTLCSERVRDKGVSIAEVKGVPEPAADFFNNPVWVGKRGTPGICSPP